MSAALAEPYVPVAVSAVDIAFPAQVSHLMPEYDAIPDEFTNASAGNPWIKFQNDWFFSGLSEPEFEPADGIDPKAAVRHLKCIQGSFEPKHEHKEAAVAYLASLWFKAIRYTTRGKRVEVTS